MYRIVLYLSVSASLLLTSLSVKGADTEYQKFLQKQRKEFKAFQAGKSDSAPAQDAAAPPAYYVEEAPSYYETLTQPGGGTTPEEKHAWRLYRMYKQTFTDEASARSALQQAQGDARALGYGFGAPFALDPKDVKDVHDAKVAINKAIELRKKVGEAWGRHFATYYGTLDEAAKTYVLKATDPRDPLKTHKIEMDKIEYRLRNYPYSQRRGNSVSEPQTAEVVPTPLPVPASSADEVADTRADPVATADDPDSDVDAPVSRVPVPEEDEIDEGGDSDEAIRVAQPDEDGDASSWDEMTPEQRHEALKNNDPEAWEQIRRDLTGDAGSAEDAAADREGKSWDEMTPAERHEALKNNDDQAWAAVRASLKSGDPAAIDAVNEALSRPDEDDDEEILNVQDVIDAVNAALPKI